MKLNTNNLKKMLSHMSKCKPNNLLEITNYYELLLNEDGLTITGTDGTNYISIYSEEGAQDDEQHIIVKADQFSRLVNKTTSENIDLKVMSDYLQVKGNGTYKCEIYADEDYPDYDIEPDKSFRVNLNQLKHGIVAGKNAKSNTASDGVLYSYLVRDNKIIAADSIKISYTPIEGLDIETLIPPSLANLINALDGDVVTVSVDDTMSSILFEGSNVTVYGSLAEGVDEYPDVSFMFEDAYPFKCILDTQSTLQALDRLRLFVGAYDSGAIDMTFTDGALILSTLTGSNEILPFSKKVEGLNEEVELRINGQYLNDIVTSMLGASYELHFGDDDSLKLVSEGDAFILATADGDDE